MTDQPTPTHCPSCGGSFGDGCMPPEMIASNIPASRRRGLCRMGLGLIDSAYDLAARLRDDTA